MYSKYKPNPLSVYYVEKVESGGWQVCSDLDKHGIYKEFYQTRDLAIAAAACLAARVKTPNQWKALPKTILMYLMVFFYISVILVLVTTCSK
jgi:hypothetical protein